MEKGSTNECEFVTEPELSGYVNEIINTQQFISCMALPQAKKHIVGQYCGGMLRGKSGHVLVES